jgi:hypothetical protein
MYRCAVTALLAVVLSAPVHAQVQRQFPQNALRGEIVFSPPPDITLNGAPARLAPGARIRNQTNLLEMSGALIGGKFTVHYTKDLAGLVKDVWILRSDELANRPWPTTPEEAQRWRFDPIAQVWSRQ